MSNRTGRDPFELSARKRALLDTLLGNRGVESPLERKIPRRDDATVAPLSFAQESLWVFEQMMPSTPLYNIATAARLTGPIHATTLEAGINEVVRRHEILRTTFQILGEGPIQCIAPSVVVPLTLVDLQQGGVNEREAAALAAMTREAHRPFDLAEGPVLRTTLWTLGPEDHCLLLVVHHIVSEASSVAIFFQELSAIYEAFLARRSSPLPPLALQYGDFAAWQRSRIRDRGWLEPLLSQWNERLRGPLPLLALPVDRPRPAARTFAGGSQSVEVSATLTAALKDLGQRQGATLFMTLLTAFVTLLHRYTSQDDVVVGVPVTHRNVPELDGLIGYFVNPQPIRINVSGDPTFRELLRRVREVCLSALSCQDVPFETLLEELRLERDRGSSPLFRAAFVLHSSSAGHSWRTSLRFPGVSQQAAVIRTRTAKLDLTLDVEEIGGCLTAVFDYNTDLFDESTIARMLQHLEVLLRDVAANPEQLVGRLQMLTEAERRRLLTEWNDTTTEYPPARTVQTVFRRKVEERPEALAVALGSTRLTYRQLDERCNRLARFLQGRGVGPDVRVGLCVERSIEFIVGALGILKAGGAYVPIDPGYPSDRIAWMLRDADVSVVLTRSGIMFPPGALDACRIDLDVDWAAIERESADAPSDDSTVDNLVYVIYTSGSTGRPKGVPIRHRNLHNLICWHQSAYQITPADRGSQVASPAFDASVWEIWPLLTAGASLHVPDGETRADAATLVRWLEAERITIAFLPTPMAEAALEESWSESPALRVLLTGGDRLRRHPRRRLPFRLVNHYGPTENTVVSTWYDVVTGVLSEGAPPIGGPLPNTVAYVVDRFLEVVPEGVPGELLVGGAQLSEGYWRRSELTREKFIPNPLTAHLAQGQTSQASTLYRTGDLVRWRTNGVLEFLGRVDDQVKIRGYRIEPGEIEAVIGEHPAVQDVVVVAREEASGDRRLVAYIVGRDGLRPTAADVRGYVARALPDYMVPSGFVLLDSLPMTANGKIDRRALPAPGAEERAATYVAPRNEVEQIMAAAWADVLAAENVGVCDNFFELGGHSLSAVRLITRLRAALAIDLPLRSIFLESTIAGLSKHIRFDPTSRSYEYVSEIPHWSCLVPIQPRGTRPPLFLVAGAHADEDAFLRYLSHMIPHLGLDQPVFALKPRGLDGTEEPHESVVDIAREYVTELRSFYPSGPYLLAGECVGGVVAFEVARQLLKQGGEVALLALLDTIRPTPWRAAVVRFGLLAARFKRYWTKGWAMLGTDPRIWRSMARDVAERRLRSHFPKTSQDVKAQRIQRTERLYPHLALAYRAKSYPGKMTLIANEQGHKADPALGWHGVAKAGLIVHVVPGNHVTRLTQYGKVVADRLLQCIEEVSSKLTISMVTAFSWMEGPVPW
jgi:amino acid adenylation domain-containing protein